jgi:hypothetical protein
MRRQANHSAPETKNTPGLATGGVFVWKQMAEGFPDGMPTGLSR